MDHKSHDLMTEAAFDLDLNWAFSPWIHNSSSSCLLTQTYVYECIFLAFSRTITLVSITHHLVVQKLL